MSDVNIETFPGSPYPLGATASVCETNFAIYVKDAKQVWLCLFDEHTLTLQHDILLDPRHHKTGEIWHIKICNLPLFTVYGYRISHNDDQSQNKTADTKLVLDPYAKAISSHAKWAECPHLNYYPLAKTIPSSTTFDWQEDRSPQIERKDLIIYEMHVRGFTQDESSRTNNPGTYLGIIEKIPYLKQLGINAIELMPIHEFNETEIHYRNPQTHEALYNYFGYSTVNFFSPMNRYASQSFQDTALIELKTMVRECHKAGIEVILDVVYNHTSEGNKTGPIYSFRALAESTYYMMGDDNNKYLNFSGCGNTTNCNHPIVIEMIISSLRYWVTEMHVDGFRFDLASIFTRASNGASLQNAPLIEAISLDPILANIKLIAEAWDVGGLYQVGNFYNGIRWSDWNGRYRDVVRKFIKGSPHQKTDFATALCGSQNLYGTSKLPICSINFVTAHDGFTLADLVSYNEKHNEENGENNRDGNNDNDSFNCGIEGYSTNKKIIALRERQMRNFHLALMFSQGIPMLLMGDEYGHSRNGNNNAWNQDNNLNWFLWDYLHKCPGFYRFYQSLIKFRQQYAILRRPTFLTEKDISWHGIHPFNPEWEHDNKLVAFTLNTPNEQPQLYIAFNAAHISQTIHLPDIGKEYGWHWVVNTYNLPPEDFFDDNQRMHLSINSVRMHAYSAIVLISENRHS